MGIAQTMTMRVTIERNKSDGKNPHGQPREDWQVWHSEIPCRVWERVGSKRFDTHIVETEDPELIVHRNKDITNKDRVVYVLDRRGRQLFGKMLIKAVTKHRDYVKLKLKRVS